MDVRYFGLNLFCLRSFDQLCGGEAAFENLLLFMVYLWLKNRDELQRGKKNPAVTLSSFICFTWIIFINDYENAKFKPKD